MKDNHMTFLGTGTSLDVLPEEPDARNDINSALSRANIELKLVNGNHGEHFHWEAGNL